MSELKSKPDYYPPVIEEVNWADYFLNVRQPDCLDIGCGKGALLLDMAEQEPAQNFLGIELRLSVVRWLDDVIRGEKIENCAALWYSVANGLGFIESNSIESVFYLFPDPWPKKKHYKRRAFNNAFLDECSRLLKPGGKLYLATDVEEVHVYHLEMLKLHLGFDFSVVTTEVEWGLPITNKERFCRLKGIETYKIVCRVKEKEFLTSH